MNTPTSILYIPSELHKKLKIEAATQGRTLKEYTINILGGELPRTLIYSNLSLILKLEKLAQESNNTTRELLDCAVVEYLVRHNCL